MREKDSDKKRRPQYREKWNPFKSWWDSVPVYICECVFLSDAFCKPHNGWDRDNNETIQIAQKYITNTIVIITKSLYTKRTIDCSDIWQAIYSLCVSYCLFQIKFYFILLLACQLISKFKFSPHTTFSNVYICLYSYLYFVILYIYKHTFYKFPFEIHQTKCHRRERETSYYDAIILKI